MLCNPNAFVISGASGVAAAALPGGDGIRFRCYYDDTNNTRQSRQFQTSMMTVSAGVRARAWLSEVLFNVLGKDEWFVGGKEWQMAR